MTISDGGAVIVNPEGTDVPRRRRAPHGRGGDPAPRFRHGRQRRDVLWDAEGDVMLVRSRVGVWSVPGEEVRAIWPHCRQLGLPEEGAPLMLVAFREAGLR